MPCFVENSEPIEQSGLKQLISHEGQGRYDIFMEVTQPVLFSSETVKPSIIDIRKHHYKKKKIVHHSCRYHHQQNKWYSQRCLLSISKQHSIIAVANLIAHNYTTISYYG